MPYVRKNGHILPTGQWYAPSVVIKDALIMPGYARACQSKPEYARVCQSVPESYQVLPKLSPDGSESESLMLLLRTGVI